MRRKLLTVWMDRKILRISLIGAAALYRVIQSSTNLYKLRNHLQAGRRNEIAMNSYFNE